VALLPAYISGRRRAWRRSARLWVGGGYAELLGGLGADVYEYETSVRGRRYRRGLVVVREHLYRRVSRVYESEKRLRRAARRYFDLLVRAFTLYSPRGVDAREALRRLLGRRLAARLLSALYERLRQRTPAGWWVTRRWLREALGLEWKNVRGYYYYMKVLQCRKWWLDNDCYEWARRQGLRRLRYW